MKKNIQHIFFDLDNTLWNTNLNFKLTLCTLFKELKIEEKHKIKFNDFYQNYFHRNEELWGLYSQNKVTKQEILNWRFSKTFEEFGIIDKKLIDLFNEKFLNNTTAYNYLVDSAIETLEYLKQAHYNLHIISNGFIDHTLNKVQGTKIKHYIDTITSGEEINKKKPAKEVFELGLEKAQTRAENSAFIGDDWEADIIGSHKAGMHSIYFNYKKEAIYTKEKVLVINELKELTKIF